MLPDVRRGILGGTFDPPHIGHLVAGETALHQLHLDVVSFLPAGAPWQKAGRPVTDSDHRWEMTKLAVEGIDYFAADDREVHRPGWTYTIDTLESLPESETLVLILGADAAAALPTWHRWREVVARAAIAVAPRRGGQPTAVEGADLIELDMPLIDVSGTELRARLHRRASVRFLVRDRVWDYLTEHGLYG